MDSSRFARPARRLGRLKQATPTKLQGWGFVFFPARNDGQPDLPEELTARMQPTNLGESVFRT